MGKNIILFPCAMIPLCGTVSHERILKMVCLLVMTWWPAGANES